MDSKLNIITNNLWFSVDYPREVLTGFTSADEIYDIGLTLLESGAYSRLNVKAAMLNVIIEELPKIQSDLRTSLAAASTIHNGVYAYINVVDDDIKKQLISILDPSVHRCDRIVNAAVAGVIPASTMMEWIIAHTSVIDAIIIPEFIANFNVIQADSIVRGLVQLITKLHNDIRSTLYEKSLVATALVESLFYIEDIDMNRFLNVVRLVPYKQLYTLVTPGVYEWLKDSVEYQG